MSFTSLVEQYRTAYQALRKPIEGLSAEQLTMKPQPEKWSITEIILHLLDSELHTSLRIKKILAEENPKLTPFDQDTWATRLKYQSLDARAALLAFGLLRELNGELLMHLSDEQWNRTGVHETRGVISVKDLIQQAIEHGENHLRQIQAIRSQLNR